MAAPSPTKTAESVPHLEEDRTLDLGIQPNQLDQFDQPTYHFRLYMMSDEAVRTRRFGPQSREERIVIAESGVTSVQIDDVEIKAVTGMAKGSGIGVSTNFSFILTQPFGATLLDEIVNAAHLLGIQNYSKAPFFLELSFKGRSREDTSSAEESDFNNLIWVWPIIFTKMSIDVNAGGSTYAVEASLFSDVSYTNHISDIDKQISIDAETVGEFYTKLALALNEREAEKVETGYLYPDTYSFQIDDAIYNEKIVPDASDERQNRAATFEKVDGKMRITFQPPIDIDKITQNILSLTKYFQTRAKGTDHADELKKANQGEEAIFQTLYRIVGDTQHGKYDAGRQDYQRHHSYLIIPYTMSTIQTQSNSEANLKSPERFAAIYRRGLLTKQYDYLYTGLNDQVLDFEVVFNFNWYAALPIQAGRYTARNTEISASKTDTHKQLEIGVVDISDPTQVLRDKIASEFPSAVRPFTGWSIEDFLKGLVPQQISDLQQSAEEMINTAQLQVSDVIGQVTDQVGSVTGQISGQVENVQAGMPGLPENIPGLPPISIVPAIPTNINATSINPFPIATQAQMSAMLQSKTQFGRVTDKSSSTAAASQQNLVAQDYRLEDQTVGEDDVKLFDVTYIESTPSKSQGGTGAYSASPGQNMLSALFEQADTPAARDLLNITLKIKGDPYWLEPNPVGRNSAPLTRLDRALADRNKDDNIRGAETSFNGVETTSQQTYFVFRNFTPDVFDPNTGITPKNNQQRNMLAGIYGVKTVAHSFSNGQFTQELHAIRDPQINLQGIDLNNPGANGSASSSAPDADSLVTVDTSGYDEAAARLASDDPATFFSLPDSTLGSAAVSNNLISFDDLSGKIGDGT